MKYLPYYAVDQCWYEYEYRLVYEDTGGKYLYDKSYIKKYLNWIFPSK